MKFDSEDKPASELRKQKYEMIRKYLNKDQLVMDYGCATGSLSLEFANNVREIHGLDISSEMIKKAETKAKEGNFHNLKFFHGDVLDEKFDSARYDVIIAFYVLHLVEDPVKVVKRISELLRPGGFLIMEIPLLGEKNLFTRSLLKTSVKMAGLPHLKSFSRVEADQMITEAKLNCVESEKQTVKMPGYFIVAKKPEHQQSS